MKTSTFNAIIFLSSFKYLVPFFYHFASKMALSILKGLLQDYVQSLLDERIVDERFSQILINLEEPDCVVQLINMYFNNVESSLSELTSYMDSVAMDSSKLSVLAHKIEDASTCIGALHVRLASIHLIQACDQGDQKIFSQALSWMKHEFAITRNKLQPILQMEQRIKRLVSKQK